VEKKIVIITSVLAMFVLVIDTTIMNVSISTLIDDFNTDVTTVQAAITLYALVMASLMITGGKIGYHWQKKGIQDRTDYLRYRFFPDCNQSEHGCAVRGLVDP